MAKRLMSMLFLFIAIFMSMVGMSLNWDPKSEELPAIYVFGDSIFDVGTNNFLPNCSTRDRADKAFYGIDFPNSTATGRFSNGFNTADRIVNLLGYDKSPPPFLYLTNNGTRDFSTEILKGVNFASGGSGILNGTGQQFVQVVPMAEQIEQFRTIRCNISQYLNGTTEDRVNKSLFLTSVGSNDILELFQFSLIPDPSNFTQKVQDFFTILMSNYQAHLTNLINLGARKFGILSVPPAGCIPILRPNASAPCEDKINFVAQLFHTELDLMLKNLSSKFPEIKYSLGNSFDITFDMINHPSSYGLNDVTSACCGNQTLGTGLLAAGVPCSPVAQVCQNRSIFLFWDQYHPTDYASHQAALKLYSAGTEYVSPINFSQLFTSS